MARNISITVIPTQIQNLRTTSVTQTTVALAWDAYPGATAYQVYRSTTQGSLGTLVLTPTATNYSNSGHTAGTTYYYTVRPVVSGSPVASAQASITVMTQSATGTGVFYQPNMATVTALSQLFDDVNNYAGGTAVLSTALMRGTSKTVRLAYPADEAGVELKPLPFAATPSLFARSYEYFAAAGGTFGGTAGWAGNWPVGLKTGRYFTRPDYSTGAEPNGSAYCSEKLAWQTYQGDPNDLYGRGYNNAIFNLDLEGTYGAGVNFANGLPYLREGYWYKLERWYVLNSAVDVADGIMQIWIDNQLVCNRTNVVWRSTSRGCPNGTGWQSMWFGGNYSGATFGNPSGTLYRYLTDFYMSSTLDR